MFYFLIITGCIFIILGVYMDKSINREKVNTTSYKEVEELYLLQNRIEHLERVLLQDVSDIEVMQEEKEIETKKEIEIEEDTVPDEEVLGYGLEKYKLLLDYEREGYCLEKISALLNMNKGEVLLLKNLYKNYSN